MATHQAVEECKAECAEEVAKCKKEELDHGNFVDGMAPRTKEKSVLNRIPFSNKKSKKLKNYFGDKNFKKKKNTLPHCHQRG